MSLSNTVKADRIIDAAAATVRTTNGTDQRRERSQSWRGPVSLFL